MDTEYKIFLTFIGIIVVTIGISGIYIFYPTEEPALIINNAGELPKVTNYDWIYEMYSCPMKMCDTKLQNKSNTSYYNVSIYADTEELMYKTKFYFMHTEDYKYIEKIYISESHFCSGEASIDNKWVRVYMCNKTTDVRGTNVTPEQWLPFVLYHEIAHIKYETHNQLLCDAYAYYVLKNKLHIGIKSIKHFDELIEVFKNDASNIS